MTQKHLTVGKFRRYRTAKFPDAPEAKTQGVPMLPFINYLLTQMAVYGKINLEIYRLAAFCTKKIRRILL
jgi:hypothetical protein